VTQHGLRDCLLSIYSVFKFPVPLFDATKDLVPAHFLYRAGDKMLGKELPALAHLVQETLHVHTDGSLVLFVGFCKYETKWDLPFAELIDEFQVDPLGGMTAVDEREDHYKVRPFPQVVFDHFFPFLPLRLGAFGKAIAGKVHEVPFVIDRKMIDQLRFAGSAGCLGQFVIVAKHIDQRRLADVAAADKGVLRPVWLWTLEIVRAADDINGRANDHAVE
jgi:hypothetical protein